MAKVLVTGGAGFIGSHLVDSLVEGGHFVTVIDNLSAGDASNVNPSAKLHRLDISTDEISHLLTDVEVIFHLAAINRIQRSINSPVLTNKHNVGGTLNVLEAARNAGVKKVVYSSSSSVYGSLGDERASSEEDDCRPQSPYGLQKHVGEHYCRIYSTLFGVDTVVLRYFNVYGPRQANGLYPAVISKFIAQYQTGEPLSIVGDGKMRRDFTHVSDVVSANLQAWKKGSFQGKVFNIGTGTNYSILELADMIGGQQVRVSPREGDRAYSLANIERSKKLLDWSPQVTLKEGVKKLKAEKIQSNEAVAS